MEVYPKGEKRSKKSGGRPVPQEVLGALDDGLIAFGINAVPAPLPEKFTFEDVFGLAEAMRQALPGVPKDEKPELEALLGQCEETLRVLLDGIKARKTAVSMEQLEKSASHPAAKAAMKQYYSVVGLVNYTQERLAKALDKGDRDEEPEKKGEGNETKNQQPSEKRKQTGKPGSGGKGADQKEKRADYTIVPNVAERDPGADTENVDDPNVPGSAEFPHDGKHQPVPKLMKYAENIILGKLREETAGDDEDAALYKTNVPKTVIQWENRARKYGLVLADGFTIVHKFTFIIGADQGDLTPCIRIDGDHGHPINEKAGKTSFAGYIVREFEAIAVTAKTDVPAAKDRLRVVAAYLERIGESAQPYLGRLPKSVLQ